MIRAVALIVVALASTAWAEQSPLGIDQTHAPAPRNTLAKPLPQIAVPKRVDRATVHQLPGGLKDRGGRGSGVKADPLTTKPVDTLHPNTRNLALVNADEIARLLDEGQAASIDAAAAIASGVTTLPDSSVQNDLEPVSEQAAYPAKP